MTVRLETRLAFQADPEDERHGTPNGLINLKCHCQRCVLAAREYQRNQKRKMRQRMRAPRGDAHGTWNTYCNFGCRCNACVFAASVQRYEWKIAALQDKPATDAIDRQIASLVRKKAKRQELLEEALAEQKHAEEVQLSPSTAIEVLATLKRVEAQVPDA